MAKVKPPRPDLSAVNHDDRWRPEPKKGVKYPQCEYTLRGKTCGKWGPHYCEPRADRVILFFSNLLMHTKGPFRRTPFIPKDWQEQEIIRPVFGEVDWSEDWGMYVRRYRIAYIIVARKNGKALDVDTPMLTGDGWKRMGDLQPGDTVHAPDGSMTKIQWVSDVHRRPTYEVEFADGAILVASDEHLWEVMDRRLGKRVTVTTKKLYDGQTYGARHDRRYSVEVPEAIERPEVDLPLDPYLLGCWLGDGGSYGGSMTSMDEEIHAAFAKDYRRGFIEQRGRATTRNYLGLITKLKSMGLIGKGKKHLPGVYGEGSAEQRLAVLQGLMDTDGTVTIGPNTPRVCFNNTNVRLAQAVLFLARSLGWKPTLREGTAKLNGRVICPSYSVAWTAFSDDKYSPFRLERKSRLLSSSGGRITRAKTNSIKEVREIEQRDAVCISVEHPSHCFLAGHSLTPTHNSELAAGILLYLLLGDDEDFAEIYSAAKDTKQAGKVFEPALRMVELSPDLRKRTKHNKNARRIIFEKTASYYEIITADAAGELGHNPHGFNLDEVLALPDDSIWNAMTSAAGARAQELILATSTETDKPHSFGANLIDEAERVQENPARSPHVFSFVRKIPHTKEGIERLHELFPGRPDLPASTDPMDERNWWWPNPALGDFKSLEAMRRQHLEAMQDPSKEVAFKQFQGNQRQSNTFRWMPMNLFSDPQNSGDIWANPDWNRASLLGRECWAGFDLSAKFDLSAWCLLFPDEEDPANGPVDVLWRFWLPEDVLPYLDKHNDKVFSRWAREGWLTVTEGDVVDYDKIVKDVSLDGRDFNILGADCDEWSTWPIIEQIGQATGLNQYNGELTAYRNTYDRMTPGMNEIMKLNRQRRFRHHGNPIAQFCFDMVEIRKAPYNPELIRPDKPERDHSGKRIDAVPTAAMAAHAWATRGRDARKSSYDETG